MTHRFPVKEIARQAGVGPATVDRVLHARANVSPQTRARGWRPLPNWKGRRRSWRRGVGACSSTSSSRRRAGSAPR